MKKFLLLLAALACVGASNAQSLSLASAAQPELPAYGLPATAPADALKWGYFLGTSFGGLGTEAAGSFGVAIKVPGTGFLQGGKVLSINLPVCFTGMSKVTVWARKNVNSTTDLFSQTVSSPFTKGYKEVVLDEPYTIDGDFYIGYNFTVANAATQDAKYPIGIAEGQAAGSLWLSLGSSFSDYSASGYGVSALQIFVEGANLDDYCAVFEAKSGCVSAASVVNNLDLTVLSDGTEPVNSIEYVAKIGDAEETGTAEVSIPGGFGHSGVVSVAYTAPAEIGAYTLDLAITKVNGQDNSNTNHVQIACENILRANPRKVLVEEFTGTGCGWCPRGWVAMEDIKATHSDVCVPIAVHQYNNTDPMYIAATSYAALPIEGAPSSVIDRKLTVDPYYGTGKYGFEIYKDIEAAYGNASIAVEVSGLYNEDKTQVEATADLEFLGDLSTYRIEFVLTADSLAGTASSWKQQNYYASQYNQSSPAFDPEIDAELLTFCSGGKNGKSSVFLTFNDVAIASSYVNRVNKAEAIPMDYEVGGNMTTTYTLTMPTKATLKNALHYDLVFVNALLFDDYGRCVNAARARVLTQEEAEGIEQITNDNVCNDGVMYNLAGQRVSKSFKGIVVKNGKKMIF